MASASSGRYQSKLFNFVHQQSRRVSEQLGTTFRHLQVATSWSAQVLLYPIYLLLQSTQLTRKLHSGEQHWPQLQLNDTNSQSQTYPTVDTPIQQVLHLVDANRSKSKAESSNGLATLASWRFKFFPQKSVSNRNHAVVQGIATQLSTRNLVLITAQNEVLDILTSQQQQKLQARIIKEVVEYWRYQTGQADNHLARQGVSHQALAFLDRNVALLESRHVAPVQVLIWAAINYFFGNRGRSELGQTTQTHSSLELLPPSRPQVVSTDNDPWLDLSDLFDTPQKPSSPSQPTKQLAKKTHPALPSRQTATSLTGYFLRQKLYNLLQMTAQSKSVSELVKRQKTIVGKVTALSNGLQSHSHHPGSQGTQIKAAPEWIETHATAMGYVKHPLEHLLEWLDRAMLWLEEVLMIVWRWLRLI